jgi:organic hydroperoxide reductase OsmC/OhrA
MINYPIEFHTQALSSSGINSNWSIQSEPFEMSCAIPVEFEGPGQALSPEDLFAQALTNCFVATFKVYAEKSRLEFTNVSCRGYLTVDLDENKKPWMKSFKLIATILSPNNVEKAKLLAEKAFKSGFILNSVKTHLSFELIIN